ncbi:MAG: squalene/phytoene synthase family protein [Chloroflexaceae bacterium]|nr:squalene/phytoene synthase family protein [Chloroflexaceae bacterium]
MKYKALCCALNVHLRVCQGNHLWIAWHSEKESSVPLSPVSALAASSESGGSSLSQPLPADEQLALLLRLADIPAEHHPPDPAPPSLNLSAAYAECRRLTRKHSKSFFFSTQFLPSEKRRAVRALYAFCRMSDDTVDMATSDPTHALAQWVRLVRAPQPHPDNPVLLAWHDTCGRYRLAPALVDELLAGIAMDLTIHRYRTFADLWLYCYRVASVVGLLSMGIMGSAPGAEPYAIKLGVALQLTNILRDVGEDARRGRVYLPEEDLVQFGLSADDILHGVCDERFKALIDFEIARTHRLYDESWYGIALLPRDSRMAVGAAARTYRAILDKVVHNNYDVYEQRAHLTSSEKLALLPGIWRDVRRLEQHQLTVSA